MLLHNVLRKAALIATTLFLASAGLAVSTADAYAATSVSCGNATSIGTAPYTWAEVYPCTTTAGNGAPYTIFISEVLVGPPSGPMQISYNITVTCQSFSPIDYPYGYPELWTVTGCSPAL